MNFVCESSPVLSTIIYESIRYLSQILGRYGEFSLEYLHAIEPIRATAMHACIVL